MPQSLSRILVHLIFSTKDRVPVLTPAIRSELHPYLAVVLRDNDCPSLRVGGAADHVHLFFGLSRTLPVAKVVEIVKTSSSKWIKTKGPEFARFHWQGGYGVFSVSQSDADAVVRYIDNQEAWGDLQPSPLGWAEACRAVGARGQPATSHCGLGGGI